MWFQAVCLIDPSFSGLTTILPNNRSVNICIRNDSTSAKV